MLRLARILRRSFSDMKEVLNYSKPPAEPIPLAHYGTNCLVIHPVFEPKFLGPEHELYRAEEAVGLVKALFWSVAKGPFWQEQFTKDIRVSQGRDEETGEMPGRVVAKRKFMKGPVKADRPVERQRMMEAGWEFSDMKHSKYRDGQYIYTPTVKGTYYKGGMYMDLESSESDDELYNEWKNKIIRNSIAKSSLMRVKRINGSHFLTKGKLHQLGEYIAENNINALFINHELSPLQTRNLERVLFRIVNGKDVIMNHKDDPMAESEYDTDAPSTESDADAEKSQPSELRRVKVFDRYTMILQIFAKRAKTGLARLQIELSFLSFARTKLIRSGTAFQSLSSIFEGDLMSAQEINLEVVSAKQRRAQGKLSGSGETQLEIQRRLINDKEAKIKKLIETETQQRKLHQQRRSTLINTIPTIALIGYTNAGKSALMNRIIHKEVVESKDRLFQTLSTTSKRIKLISGQKAILLDTIGFISDLPHDLVESFKSTLEEVGQADLVLHIRDISHPCSEQQKKVVLQVLKDLKFNAEFYSRRMIEVWNKVDLLTTPVDYASIEQSDYPVVPTSALMNLNINKLLEVIEQKSNALLGKRMIRIRHSLAEHGTRLQWLYSNANISNIENETHYEEPGGKHEIFVSFDVLLDDVVYNRYKTTFSLDIDTNKKRATMPPPDWHLKPKK